MIKPRRYISDIVDEWLETYDEYEEEESILSEFDSVKTAGRHKILNYFVKNKLNDLIGNIQEF